MKDRLISLTDGTDMGGMLIIFKTNAPVNVLKEIEVISNGIYINGGDEDDVPVWREYLKQRGYNFEYIDECCHVTPFETSNDWLTTNYSQITEHYVIENQPNILG